MRGRRIDQRQGLIAAEARHVVVGDDDVPLPRGERRSERRPRVHARDVGLKALALELDLQQPGIILGIFDHQDVDGP